MRVCRCCKDREGFRWKPCPACGNQKPATLDVARRYGIEPGDYVTDEARAAYLQRISTGKPLGRTR